MQKRFISIWFRYLETDWFIRRQPSLATSPFVLASPDHGRMVINAANKLAEAEGIYTGMAVADARGIFPSLQVLDHIPETAYKLLSGLAEWFIRFTPSVAIDLPDSLILDATGCTHLWGGEKEYLTDINKRMRQFGYDVRLSIADTVGTAWAIARFGTVTPIIKTGEQQKALLSLPPSALRLEMNIIERLEKLGLRQIQQFIDMPRPALRRRFGAQILLRLDQAIGVTEEFIQPVQPIEPYHERLPCLEPIVTSKGIEIAITRLLEAMCKRLQDEGKGLRVAMLKCYRVDGKTEMIKIGTNSPSSNTKHLFKLFEIKIDTIEPALGIELFTLDASKVEDLSIVQETFWKANGGLLDNKLSELLDRIGGKFGENHIHRFMPDEHHWPERSFKVTTDLQGKLEVPWKVDRPRPLQILTNPQPIDVMAPIPDYPPMSFRYKGTFHKIVHADGPERLEQEWWLQQGQHRDYYNVEDDKGKRYWLFRLGHYNAARSYQWFIHGFFA